MAVTEEEIQATIRDSKDTIEEAKDSLVKFLISGYKAVDMKPIAKVVAEGDLIGAYVSILNMEADHFAKGGKHIGAEYEEIQSMKRHCEHWIAARVLEEAGWKSTSVIRYFQK